MIRRLRIDENEVRFMRKTKGFTIAAVLFYVWYMYSSAVYEFAYLAEYFVENKVWWKTLMATTPLMWLGGELAASILFICAPFLFVAATVIIDLMPSFTKKQKILLTVLPIAAYALLWILDFIPTPQIHLYN